MTRVARTGWMLFLAGCLLFTVQGIAAGDVLTAIGGGLFTAGCGALLYDGSHHPH